jgi:hypothetical protein
MVKYYYYLAVSNKTNFPKSVITIKAISQIPKDNPLMIVAGLGPGQFSSRASLILSGVYIGGKDYQQRKQLDNKTNPMMKKYLLPIIVNSKSSLRGSTSKPYYSLLSLFTEMGLLGIVGLVFVVIRVINKIRIKNIFIQNRIKYLFTVQISFLLLLAMQENYLEFTQAIFPGLLLMKLQYSALQ